MLGYTRIRNGLCAICRWSKNCEVNRRGRDKKITPGGRFWGQWAAPPQPAWRLHLRRGARGYGLPRAQSALAMTNRGPLPFYRYPIRIGGAAPGGACRSPTAHGRRSVYFSFFLFQSSGFISMRPSPTMHERKLSTSHFQFSTSIPLCPYT